MNKRLIVALLTAAWLAVGVVVGVAAEGNGKHPVHAAKPNSALAAQAKVKMETARATALAKVPRSKFKAVELERENGKLIWSFELVVPHKPGIEEVNVDAISGKIVSLEHEGPGTEAREAKQERAEARRHSTKAAKASKRH